MPIEVARAEPEDFLVHYEMLRMQINMVLPMIKRVAQYSCDYIAQADTDPDCVFCEARQFLDDIGIQTA